ncbi:uncharacterized protein SCODWIG_02601 [Saccharomycodes ludwigii]|uniref:Reduced meiotic recombination protein 1 n=1 Tax=Saccharomycodes ludwigii TaxID=36035 RepID=A0A376B9P0_9ASCO|nr:hypothetical protein SCDLUD_002253 [Saccharomycodes ludwigii]KAH3900800.1 hypothetical protein SCDLUD_002253 [Saccharomycodes ludwigii]SSD60840.1 uncharacterized protein SCODWIG_02601 [Saccharomycodes ludwigii]
MQEIENSNSLLRLPDVRTISNCSIKDSCNSDTKEKEENFDKNDRANNSTTNTKTECKEERKNINRIESFGESVNETQDEDQTGEDQGEKNKVSNDEFRSSKRQHSDLYEIASDMLRNATPIPNIELIFEGISYSLFKLGNDNNFDLIDDENENDDNVSYGQDLITHLFHDIEVLNYNMEQFFYSLRKVLERIEQSANLRNKELIIEVPALDLKLTEDNKYNKCIELRDILSIFEGFEKNSKATASELNHLVLEVELGVRFLTRYNDLVDLMHNNATFNQINGFSNDKTHPVVLDDLNTEDNTKPIEIMEISENEDNE